MKLKTDYWRLWCILSLLFIMCSSSDVTAGTYKAGRQGKLTELHQKDAVIVAVRDERSQAHGNEAKRKWTEATDDAESGTIVDGKTLEEWLKKLDSRDPNDRISACMALEKMGPAARPAIPALRRALRDEDVTVRILAASTLGGLGPDAAKAVPDLVAALKDKNEYVRVFAVTALGKIGTFSSDVSGALQNALNDSNALVSSQAEWALQQINIQDRSVEKKKGTKAESLSEKSYTPALPQKISSRAFQSQGQQLFFDPVIIDPDDPNFDDARALVEAAAIGDHSTVELLLKRGAGPDWTIGETQRTPLHEASALGRIEIVRTLIQAAIDGDRLNRVIGATDQRHRTPLHDAALGGNIAVAVILLDHGAVIDAANMDGLHPLHLAVIKGSDKMVELLLAKGAYVSARDEKGRTPEDYARALGHQELALRLADANRRYWESPTVREIHTTIKNYFAAVGMGDVPAARKISTERHHHILEDSLKPFLFHHVIKEIKWHKDEANATARIKTTSGTIPFFCFLGLKKNKEGWKIDNTDYGFMEQWEEIK